jgi:hypothetical protein
MHAVMDRLMRNRQVGAVDQANPRHWLGAEFVDRKLTQDHIDTMIHPALEALHQLEENEGYGGNFRVLGVEARVQFPGIPSAFGTCDLILGNDTHVLWVDWKFGAGVGVQASYTDGENEKLNPQMMFYLTAGRHSLKKLYKGKRQLVIAIIQPRGDVPLSHAIVTPRDIKWFTEDLQDAVATALDRDPPRHRGDHCRFAGCKVNCPLWTGPLLQLADMQLIPRTEVVTKEPSPYGEYLARAKALVDIVAAFKKEVDEQLHAFLEDGGTVPGWKLKAKARQRQWVDEDTVFETLIDLGFKTDEIYQTKLQTFASVDATARRLGVQIPDHLRVTSPTNETTICPADDPAPAVERATALEQFRASIPLLARG